MNPLRFWFAVFALLGIAMVVPGWMYFAGPGLTNTPIETAWLVAIMLPFLVMVTVASWVQTWS